jgi:hypothetical protein
MPFLQGHNCGALILQNSFVGMDANIEFVTQLASLNHSPGMACGLPSAEAGLSSLAFYRCKR